MADKNGFSDHAAEIIREFRQAEDEAQRLHAYRRLEATAIRYLLHPSYRGPISRDDAKEIFDASVCATLPYLLNPLVPERKAARELKAGLNHYRDRLKNIYRKETRLELKPTDNGKYDIAFNFEPPVPSSETLVTELDLWAAAAELLAPFIQATLDLLPGKDRAVLASAYPGLCGEAVNSNHVQYKHRSARYRAVRRARVRFNGILERLVQLGIELERVRPDQATLKQTLRIIQGGKFFNVITSTHDFSARRVRGNL